MFRQLKCTVNRSGTVFRKSELVKTRRTVSVVRIDRKRYTLWYELEHIRYK